MQAAVNFGNQQSADEPLAGASPLAVNVLVDGHGAVRRRPGLVAYGEAPAGAVDANGITGLYLTTQGQLLAVGGGANRKVYRLAGGAATEITSAASGYLAGDTRPTWAENAQYVFLAGGHMPRKIFKNSLAFSTLGEAPRCSHILQHASRLLANDLSGPTTRDFVQYSSTGLTGIETWVTGAARFFSAEARADAIVAVVENSVEVFVFGETTLQVFASDPASVYSPSRTKNIGCIAPFSIVRVEESFFWLDAKKRLVISDGREMQVISTPIAATLAGIETVSDCYGFHVVTDQFDCLAWTFPTDGRTFAWARGGGWSQWHGWADNNYAVLPIGAHLMRVDTAENIVGLTDGRVVKLSPAVTTDMGTPIVAEVRTGFLSRETDLRKHCVALRLAFRRGETASSTAPVALLSWRDDLGEWTPAIEISLGAAGDFNPVVELRSLGTYRRRQWRLVFSSNEPVVLAGATEEYNVLGSTGA